jgi:hypothetical protein
MAASDTPGPNAVDDEALAELRSHEAWHGPYIVRSIERHHPETHPGIPLSLFDAYTERLGYDVERSRADVEERVVDEPDWQDDDVYYRVGNNVSAYPESWHSQYEESGIRGLVAIMRHQLGRDVRRDELLLAVEAIDGVDRRMADAMLTAERKEKRVVVRPRTNPEAFVYPAKLKE